jgi:spore maturation protein CgeB
VKILILNEGGHYTLGASYARAFRHLGHEVGFLNPQRGLSAVPAWRFGVTRRLLGKRIVAHYSRGLLQRILQFPAELIWVGKGMWSHPWMWNELKSRRPSVKLVCYNPDNPIIAFSKGGNRSWVSESIPCYDLYCTYNASIVDSLQRAGAKHVLHLPFAWDPDLHPEIGTTPDEHRRYACDILFIGNLDEHREWWLHRIAEEAKKRGWCLRLYGNPRLWRRCRHKLLRASFADKPLYGEDLVKATRSAKVCLNILRLQNIGSHNMRTFEIPGSGGCMLSQFSDEQNGFFPHGKAALYFRDREDAVSEIVKVLGDGRIRQRIITEASKLVKTETYIDRGRTLLAVMGLIDDHC